MGRHFRLVKMIEIPDPRVQCRCEVSERDLKAALITR